MSIKAVNESVSYSPPCAVSSWGQSLKSYFWGSKLTVDNTSSLENAELTRFFNRLLSAGVVGSGVCIASLALFEVIAWPVGFLVIPCALTSMGLNLYNSQVSDFESPYELEQLQNKASKMSLNEVIQTYGWSDMLRLGILSPDQFSNKYRQHLKGKSLIEVINYYEKTLCHVSQCSSPKYSYRVPHPREFAALWRQETVHINCEQIFQRYPLEKLEKYSLIGQGELNCIKNLKGDYDAIKMQHDQKIFQIEQEFLSSIVIQKRTYETECLNAEQVYNNSAFIRELHGIEMYYAKERLKVQEQQNKSVAEARSRFNNSLICSIGGNYHDYARLTPAKKAIYDQCMREFKHAESTAHQTAYRQIDQINKQRNDRLQYLHTEEARLKQVRIQSIGNAKVRYDESIREFLQKKEVSLKPIQAALNSTADDCDGRYRAYLRISGARNRD